MGYQEQKKVNPDIKLVRNGSQGRTERGRQERSTNLILIPYFVKYDPTLSPFYLLL